MKGTKIKVLFFTIIATSVLKSIKASDEVVDTSNNTTTNLSDIPPPQVST